jgi:hypothetical protein
LPFLPGFSEIGIINLGGGPIEEVDEKVLWWVGVGEEGQYEPERQLL